MTWPIESSPSGLSLTATIAGPSKSRATVRPNIGRSVRAPPKVGFNHGWLLEQGREKTLCAIWTKPYCRHRCVAMRSELAWETDGKNHVPSQYRLRWRGPANQRPDQ